MVIFWQLPTDHLQGHGCPLCKTSTLEQEITNFLKEREINFIPQYRTEWLGRQSLDFYLPDQKIAIECQGRQHFLAIDFFGGDESLKYSKERDERKKRLCEKHGIKLLYFSSQNILDQVRDKPIEKIFTDVKGLLEEIKKVDN